jgi:hypothetical protein
MVRDWRDLSLEITEVYNLSKIRNCQAIIQNSCLPQAVTQPGLSFAGTLLRGAQTAGHLKFVNLTIFKNNKQLTQMN